jgi:DNA repair exonuclease SbcCD ATPase subunit
MKSAEDVFKEKAKKFTDDLFTDIDRTLGPNTGLNLAQQGSYLERQRLLALEEFRPQKGSLLTGNSINNLRAETLAAVLDKIDTTLNSIRQKQADIVRSLRQESEYLGIADDESVKILQDWDLINQKVKEFLEATGGDADSINEASAFIQKTYARGLEEIFKSIDEERDAFEKGAEDAAGRLISLEQDAINRRTELEKNYLKTINELTKQKDELIKNQDKARLEDVEAIRDLEKEIVELREEEQKQITTIQNEGIAEREKTTVQDKADRIAAVQDEASKRQAEIEKEITRIREVAEEREAAYLERLAQIAEERAQLETNFVNESEKITNQMNRLREAHMEKLAQLEALMSQVNAAYENEISKIDLAQHAFIDSLRERERAYEEYLNNVRRMEAVYISNPGTTASNRNLNVGGVVINVPGGYQTQTYAIEQAVQRALKSVAEKVTF